MYRVYKNNKAFTLVELLVTVAIVVILTAAAIPGFSTYRSKQDLSSAADIVQAKIYDARSLALAPDESKPANVKYYAVLITTDAVKIYEKKSISKYSTSDRIVDQFSLDSSLKFENNPNYFIFFSIEKYGKIERVINASSGGTISTDGYVHLTLSSEKVNETKKIDINTIIGQVMIK